MTIMLLLVTVFMSPGINSTTSGGDAGTCDAEHNCQKSAAATYSWLSGGWGSCTKTCGAGTKTRSVTCRSSSGATASDASCSGSKPATSKSCNLATCTSYAWMLTSAATYGTCTKACGGGGTQARTGNACIATTGSSTSIVANSFCTAGATNSEPAASKACNTGACAAQWAASAFGECSLQCGGGKKTRTVECFQVTSDDIAATGKVANSVCTTAGAKDLSLTYGGVAYPSTGTAFGPSANTFSNKKLTKVAGDACTSIAETLTGKVALINRGGCSFAVKVKMAQDKGAVAVLIANNAADAIFTLGGGDASITIPTRFVSQADGVAITNAAVGNLKVALGGSAGTPATEQSCNTQACATYGWTTGAYSGCSKTCGGGTKTRTVACKDNTGASAGESKCTQTKPATSSACKTAACPVPTNIVWVSDSWGACSVTCASGTQTRAVKCRDTFATESDAKGAIKADSACTAAKPATSKACTLDACPVYAFTSGNWGGCSKTCGTGSRTRTVTCMETTKSKAVTDKMCTDAGKNKPATTQNCNTQACPILYEWNLGNFGACSTTCGDGSQTRTVACRERVSKNAASDGKCSGEGNKPSTTQVCSNAACITYAWIASGSATYGACTTTCGGGTQARTGSSCKSTQGSKVTNVADSFCTTKATNTEPAKSKACNTDACIRYEWNPSAWGACSTTCGDGKQTRSVACREVASKKAAADGLCPAFGSKPDTEQACSNAACITYAWVASGSATYAACTTTCGGGTQARTGSSCKSTQGSKVTNVADSFCTTKATNTEPAKSKACNAAACAVKWVNTTWSGCSKECGTGQKTRAVTCQEDKDGSWQTVADNKCNAAGKPAVSQNCNTQACPTYRWVTGAYGVCDKTCGTGAATRTVACQDDGGASASESLCTETKPATSGSCIKPDCTDHKWVAEAYGACDVTCGSGTQDRVVNCRNALDKSSDAKGAIVAQSKCSGAGAKPATQRACPNLEACPVYKFVLGAWGACDKACGGGSRTRTVACTETTKSVAATDKQCTDSGLTKPATSEACNTGVCPAYSFLGEAWGVCSVTCGSGTQDRVVNCRDTKDTAADAKGAIVGDAQCSGTKPNVQRACPNLEACPVYKFINGAYGACSKTCGGGTQARTVTCTETTKSVAATDKQCTDTGLSKPASSQACKTAACPISYAWSAKPWSACSKTCGEGAQTRIVSCEREDTGAKTANEGLCTGTKPTETKVCSSAPCTTYSWVLPAAATYTDCSTDCGGGKQTRTGNSCSAVTGSTTVKVADSFCKAATNTEPVAEKACGTDACPTQWSTGAWGECSVECGGGTHTRSVKCMQTKDKINSEVNATKCASAGDGEVTLSVGTGTDSKLYTSTGTNFNPSSKVSVIGDVSTPNLVSVAGDACTSIAETLTGKVALIDRGGCSFTVKVKMAQDKGALAVVIANNADTALFALGGTDATITIHTRFVSKADGAALRALGAAQKVATIGTGAAGATPANSEACNTAACPTYRWVKGTWGVCSKTCGTGTRARSVQCEDDKGAKQTDVAKCTGAKPEVTGTCAAAQACPEDPKKTKNTWIAEAYAKCSVECGEGVKTRAVRCRDTMDTDADPLGKITDDFMCTKAKLPTTDNCEEKACPEYVFQTGVWSKCSKDCDAGTRTRTAQCYDTVAKVTAAPKQCTDRGLTTLSTSRNCNVKACGNCGTVSGLGLKRPDCTGVWQMTAWSSCTIPCGFGEQTRTVTCQATADGKTLADDECGGARPTTTADCNAHACPTYTVGAWSACDAKCDNGNRMRSVDCVDHNGNVVDKKGCTAILSPPETTSACNDRPCGHWHRNPWGECDQLCATAKSGGTPGAQSRAITCRLPHDDTWKGVAVAPWDKADLCPSDAKEIPAVSQACNIEACGTYYWDFAAWSACDKTCGSGTQSTTAVCKSSATGAVQADDSVCGAKPAVSRACNTNPCSTYEWGYGNSAATTAESAWGLCDASCGEGKQTRTVECRDTTSVVVVGYKIPYEVVAETKCSGSGAKPATEQTCGAVVAGECGANGKCEGKKCSCSAGFGGGTCDVAPAITNVEVRLDGSHDSVAHGDVVVIRWESTGDLKDVDILLLKPGSTYPITLTATARARNTDAADRVFLWQLPAPESAAAKAIGGGEFNVIVQFSSTIKGTSPLFKVESPCFVTNCGPNGACGAKGQCTCTNGFTGVSCAISPCAAKKCGVQGTCAVDAAGAKCVCAKGWKGDTCVTPDTCTGQAACLNGGVREATGVQIDGEAAKCGTCACLEGSEWQGDTCSECKLTCMNKGKVNAACNACDCGENSGYFGDKCSCRYYRVTMRINVRGQTSDALIANADKLKKFWELFLTDVNKLLTAFGFKGTVEAEVNGAKTSTPSKVLLTFKLKQACKTTTVGCATGPNGGFYQSMALAAGEVKQEVTLDEAHKHLLAQIFDEDSVLRTNGIVTSDFDPTFPPEVTDPTGTDAINGGGGGTGTGTGTGTGGTGTGTGGPGTGAGGGGAGTAEGGFPLTIVLIAGCAGLAFIVIVVVAVVVVKKRNAAHRGLGGKVPTFRMNDGQRAVSNPLGATSATPGIRPDSLARVQKQGSVQMGEMGKGPSGGKKEYATAAFAYEAANGDELSFNKGDKIEVLEEVTSSSSGTGWGRGRINGKVGYYPGNYIVTDVE